MNVLWLSHFLPYPPKGGALQRSYHLLRQAASRHRVHLVMIARQAVPATRDLLAETQDHFQNILEASVGFPPWCGHSEMRRWLLVAATGLSPNPFDLTSLQNRAMHRYLRQLVPRKRIDLIHVDTIGLWPYVAHFDRAGVVLHHHNVESQLTKRRAKLERHLLRRAYLAADARKLRRLEQKAGASAHANVVVSRLDADRLGQIVPTASTWVVDNGVDPEYFRPDQAVRPLPGSLVFAGGMNWYPNRDAAAFFVKEIWPILSQQSPDSTITFVGQDPIPDLASQSDPRIRAPGFVDDVRPFLDEAEIYVCPIRDGGGTRLKILDALAMAKPIVATGLAVEGLDLVDGTHYLRAEGPHDFVAAIQALRQDPALRSRLGKAGRQLAETRYSWTAIGRALDEVYQAVIGMKRGGPNR